MQRIRRAVAASAVFAFVVGAGLAWWHGGVAPAEAQANHEITVYKTPTCGCCTLWVDYLRDEGFEVTAHDVSFDEMDERKRAAGLPRELASCHTGFIDGYVIEGHVPAGDIRRLLRERPEAAGIAVPGMPIGSPGMEVGDRLDPYETILFRADGTGEVFERHNH